MTLRELKKRVDRAINTPDAENLEVCITNNKGGWGGTAVTKVKHATKGFDWDSDKFMISPEVEMIEK